MARNSKRTGPECHAQAARGQQVQDVRQLTLASPEQVSRQLYPSAVGCLLPAVASSPKGPPRHFEGARATQNLSPINFLSLVLQTEQPHHPRGPLSKGSSWGPRCTCFRLPIWTAVSLLRVCVCACTMHTHGYSHAKTRCPPTAQGPGTPSRGPFPGAGRRGRSPAGITAG